MSDSMIWFYVIHSVLLLFIVSITIALIIVTSIFYKKAKRIERDELKELQAQSKEEIY